MIVCRQCGSFTDELWNGKCSKCNPDLAAAVQRRLEREKRKRALYFALRSRVLKEEEMQEVEQWDYLLLVPERVSYSPIEVKTEFNAALLQQFKIRRAAESGGGKE